MTRRASSRGTRSRARLEHLLDRFASRAGIGLTLATLVALIGYAAASLNSGVHKIIERDDAYTEVSARLPLATLSDVQRLKNILYLAQVDGRMTDRARDKFARSLDILFVRADTFPAAIPDYVDRASADAAIRDLHRIVRLGDDALAQGVPDIDRLTREVAIIAEAVRRHLSNWNDVIRHYEARMLDEQVQAIRYQQFVTRIALAAAGLIGIGALLLLRAEVASRQQQRQAEERVSFLALYDDLTGLPNRASLHDHLDLCLDDGNPFSLLILDLDEFKAINDTYGHAGGDAALIFVGAVLKDFGTKHRGFAGRLGGDEFALVLPVVNQQHVMTVCQDILTAIAEGVVVGGDRLPVGVSIGVAPNSAIAWDAGDPLDSIVRIADFALYASKEAGRGCATPYDRKLEERYRQRRAMQDALPHAISSGAIEVYFQPKVTLNTRCTYGFEALARWNWNGRMVPPDAFVALAEEAGLIFELDLSVMTEATRLTAEWNFAHKTDLSVSVNLSALHLSTKRIVNEVQQILRKTGLPPHLLTLEITETVEIRDWGRVHGVLDDLRQTGCRISVDDFGTGFSSMAYLRAISAHELKIDRTLVSEIDNSDEARFIFDAVLDLARNLGMSVVVEGIETDAQAEAIARLGGLSAQGHLFGRPEPALSALARTLAPGARQSA